MTRSLTLLAFSCIVAACLLSCTPTISYRLVVQSVDNAETGPITFTFTERDGDRPRDYRYALSIRDGAELRVKQGTSYSGMKYDGQAEVRIRPDPDNLPSGGQLELFVYDPIVTKKIGEGRYEVGPSAGVIAYYLDYISDDRVLRVISKTNSFQLSTHQVDVRDNWTLADLQGDFKSFVVGDQFAQLGKGGLVERGGARGGYIVRSKLTATPVMLN